MAAWDIFRPACHIDAWLLLPSSDKDPKENVRSFDKFVRHSVYRNMYEQSFSQFLNLPVEIRHIIYDTVFSQRKIILAGSNATEVSNPTEPISLKRSPCRDSTIALLQTCKQVHNEARKLAQRYIPSCLVLSSSGSLKSTYRGYVEFWDRYGILRGFITRFDINAASLSGDLTRYCTKMFVEMPDQDPRSLKYRFPGDVGLINSLRHMLLPQFPAWRELHIYDMLSTCLWTKGGSCTCPGQNRECRCGKCKCECVSVPRVEMQKHMSRTEIKDHLSTIMMAHYRTVIPSSKSETSRPQAWQYHGLLQLLGAGIELVFHDEIPLSVQIGPEVIMKTGDTRRQMIMHKGNWHATYRLKPPLKASKALEPPLDLSQPLLQLKKTSLAEFEPSVWSLNHKRIADPHLTDGSPVSSLVKLIDAHRRKPSGHVVFSYPVNDPRFSQALPSLTDFEAGLSVQLMDSEKFDFVMTKDSTVHDSFKAEQEKSDWWRW